jgi:hypothetical protein
MQYRILHTGTKAVNTNNPKIEGPRRICKQILDRNRFSAWVNGGGVCVAVQRHLLLALLTLFQADTEGACLGKLRQTFTIKFLSVILRFQQVLTHFFLVAANEVF